MNLAGHGRKAIYYMPIIRRTTSLLRRDPTYTGNRAIKALIRERRYTCIIGHVAAVAAKRVFKNREGEGSYGF